MSLPFKTDHAPADRGQLERWLKALDEVGVENVRIRLAQSNPDGVLERVGSETGVSAGFVEDWLRYNDRRSRAVQQRWRWAIFIPAFVSAVGACIGVLSIARPHLSRVMAPIRASVSVLEPKQQPSVVPSATVAKGAVWSPISVDQYVTINGNVFLAECGTKPESIQFANGGDIVRFQMMPNNRWYNDGGDERTELDGYKQPFQVGIPYWLAYTLYLEPGPPLTSDWMVLGQIPGLMGHFIKNTIMTWSAAKRPFHSEAIARGVNYHFVEKFVMDPVNGYYGSWFNGKQVADFHGPMGDAGKNYYVKFGIYRGIASETLSVRYANYKFGTDDLSTLITNPDPDPQLTPWP